MSSVCTLCHQYAHYVINMHIMSSLSAHQYAHYVITLHIMSSVAHSGLNMHIMSSIWTLCHQYAHYVINMHIMSSICTLCHHSLCSTGSCTGVVLRTGDRTLMGHIAQLTGNIDTESECACRREEESILLPFFFS